MNRSVLVRSGPSMRYNGVRDAHRRPPIKPTIIQMSQRTATAILDESFLDMRAKLLELAATLDRIERSSDDGQPLTDSAIARRGKLDEAIRILLSEGPDRALRLQRLFSREYEAGWRDQMHI